MSDNILYLNSIDLDKNEIKNARLHNFASLPVLTDPSGSDLNYVGLVAYLPSTGVTYVLNNVSGIATWEPLGKGNSSNSGGGIYLMGVSASGSENAYATKSNYDLEDITEVAATTTTILFTVYATAGVANMRPTISYTLGNNTTEYIIPDLHVTKLADRPVYSLTNYSINLGTATYITFKHSDGATKRVDVRVDSKPIISGIQFINVPTTTSPYPGTQIHLATGNRAYATVTAANGDTISKVIISGSNYVNSTYEFSDVSSTRTIDLTCMNTASELTQGYVSIQIEKPGGAKSTVTSSSSFGSVSGVNFLWLSNAVPVFSTEIITFGTVSGNTVTALSRENQASVQQAITLNSSGNLVVSYSSSQLNIPNPDTYQLSKSLTASSAIYNVTTPNYTITATNTYNGRSVTKTILVRLANVYPTPVVTLPAARLISSPTGQSHYIQVMDQGGQQLLSGTLAPAAGGGTWVNSNNNLTLSGTQILYNTLNVTDSMVKGTYSWASLSITNVGGLTTVASTRPSYILGGFTKRTVSIQKGQNISPDINVQATASATNGTLSRCVVTWRGLPMGTQYAIGSPAPTENNANNASKPESDSWAVSAIGTNPFQVRLLNYGTTSTSTQTTELTIEEPA